MWGGRGGNGRSTGHIERSQIGLSYDKTGFPMYTGFHTIILRLGKPSKGDFSIPSDTLHQNLPFVNHTVEQRFVLHKNSITYGIVFPQH
jgi:hypothetical protein